MPKLLRAIETILYDDKFFFTAHLQPVIDKRLLKLFLNQREFNA
jgi:hypothetical protein